MTKRIGGFRRKTRHKFRRNVNEKGKVNSTEYFKELKEGDTVILKANPSIQKGMYLQRFHGKSGIIVKKQGKAYVVKIKDHDKEKLQIIHPVHLKKW